MTARPPGWGAKAPASPWPPRYSGPGWPVTRSAPRMPDLSAGHCVTGKAGMAPGAWTGEDPELRELAAVACSWCPVLAACGAWAIASPPPRTGSPVITAGMTAAQIRAARKRQQRG